MASLTSSGALPGRRASTRTGMVHRTFNTPPTGPNTGVCYMGVAPLHGHMGAQGPCMHDHPSNCMCIHHCMPQGQFHVLAVTAHASCVPSSTQWPLQCTSQKRDKQARCAAAAAAQLTALPSLNRAHASTQQAPPCSPTCGCAQPPQAHRAPQSHVHMRT